MTTLKMAVADTKIAAPDTQHNEDQRIEVSLAVAKIGFRNSALGCGMFDVPESRSRRKPSHRDTSMNAKKPLSAHKTTRHATTRSVANDGRHAKSVQVKVKLRTACSRPASAGTDR